MAVSPGPLRTKKATSLDVHVPSLRRRRTGACDWATRPVGAPQGGGRGASRRLVARWGRRPECPAGGGGHRHPRVLPQACWSPGTPRAAFVWSTSRKPSRPGGGPWGCWPPWNTASSWPRGLGTRPCPRRRRCGTRMARPTWARAPLCSPLHTRWSGGQGGFSRCLVVLCACPVPAQPPALSWAPNTPPCWTWSAHCPLLLCPSLAPSGSLSCGQDLLPWGLCPEARSSPADLKLPTSRRASVPAPCCPAL